ncbi:MAG: SLC13 family permease [Cellvibrionaceae bacterium]
MLQSNFLEANLLHANLVHSYGQSFVALNLLVIIGLLVFTRIRPWVVFLGSSGALYLSGVVSIEGVMKGYTNPSLLVLVLLYLISIPLERTSLLRRITAKILGPSERRSVLRLGLFSGLFSAIVNNTAVVASMLSPLKKQTQIDASKLLLPLSYASIIGGTLTLIGTSTNLIVNGFVQQYGYPSLGFFDFTVIGLPVFVCSLAVIVAISPKVLRAQSKKSTATVQEYFLERKITAGSKLSGRTVQDNGLRQLEKMFLIEVIRGHKVMAPVGPQEVLKEGDILVFTGDLSEMALLDDFHGLESVEDVDQALRDNLVEVIVSPSASLIDRTIKQVDFRAKFDAAVVAVRRGDQRLAGGLGKLVLQAGDTLVLAVGDDFLRRQNLAADFIVVGDVDSKKALSQREEAGLLAGFIAIVGLGATGFVPLLKGLVVLVALLMLGRILSKDDLKARFPFELMVVVASALGLAQAMFDTGLAESISQLAGSYLSALNPTMALIGVFVIAWLLTELITNNAAAAIMFPLAIAVSSQWGVGYAPFVMAVAFGASASFLSPYGYQTNLMVYTAGNYRVSDYLRLGGPVLLMYSAMSLTMITLIYGV